MQISVEETSELGRKMTIQLPEEAVQKEMNKKLQSLAREVRISGFRPGKVPMSVVKKRFGGHVKEEVLSELIQSSFRDAVAEQQLQLAGQPEIKASDAETLAENGFNYIANFEVLPKIELINLSEIGIKRPMSEIKESDIDTVVERVREQRKTWRAVERPAEEGDQVTVNFTGETADGPFTEKKVENFAVTLGSGQMIPGFEDQLKGCQADQKLSFELNFPEEYGREDLAGKAATFAVEVLSVEISEQPELNEEFIKSLDVEDGTVETFRQEIKENLEYQLDQMIKSRVKTGVIDALVEHHPLTLPESMVKLESQALYDNAKASAQQKGQALSLSDEQVEEQFGAAARRRVAVSMIFSEILDTNSIQLDQQRVQETLASLAENYQDPQSVVNYYANNAEARNQIESSVLEEQAVDWVLDQVTVVDEPVEFSALLQPESPEHVVAED